MKKKENLRHHEIQRERVPSPSQQPVHATETQANPSHPGWGDFLKSDKFSLWRTQIDLSPHFSRFVVVLAGSIFPRFPRLKSTRPGVCVSSSSEVSSPLMLPGPRILLKRRPRVVSSKCSRMRSRPAKCTSTLGLWRAITLVCQRGFWGKWNEHITTNSNLKTIIAHFLRWCCWYSQCLFIKHFKKLLWIFGNLWTKFVFTCLN